MDHGCKLSSLGISIRTAAKLKIEPNTMNWSELFTFFFFLNKNATLAGQCTLKIDQSLSLLFFLITSLGMCTCKTAFYNITKDSKSQWISTVDVWYLIRKKCVLLHFLVRHGSRIRTGSEEADKRQTGSKELHLSRCFPRILHVCLPKFELFASEKKRVVRLTLINYSHKRGFPLLGLKHRSSVVKHFLPLRIKPTQPPIQPVSLLFWWSYLDAVHQPLKSEAIWAGLYSKCLFAGLRPPVVPLLT